MATTEEIALLRLKEAEIDIKENCVYQGDLQKLLSNVECLTLAK